MKAPSSLSPRLARNESCGNTGLVYCPHSQEFVSRSTFRRHQLLWVERKRKHTTSSGSPDFDDDSADSDPAYMHGKHGLSLFFCNFFASLYVSPNRYIPSNHGRWSQDFKYIFPQWLRDEKRCSLSKEWWFVWQNSGRSSPLYSFNLK